MVTKEIDIEGSFTIENAGNIQEKMREALGKVSGESQLALDLKNVTEFDGAGLQLLLAFEQASEKLGAKMNLKNIPEHISAVLERYGLSDRFASNPTGKV